MEDETSTSNDCMMAPAGIGLPASIDSSVMLPARISFSRRRDSMNGLSLWACSDSSLRGDIVLVLEYA